MTYNINIYAFMRKTWYLHKIRRVLISCMKGGHTVLSIVTYVRGHRNSSVKKVRVNKQPGKSLNGRFIRPSSDGTYYGMVMSVRPGLRPSDSPSVHPSVRVSVRPPVFRTFLQHALTYWTEILHMTLFQCTTDQVWLSSLCVSFWRSYASLWI